MEAQQLVQRLASEPLLPGWELDDEVVDGPQLVKGFGRS